jgi:DNA-binding transcriptional MocR family regulator
VPDRAIRLFALLTRYADRDGRGFPGRRALAERLRCSVDSIDRALRELVDAGAVRVEERWDVVGDGGRLTNDYHRWSIATRTPAAPMRLPPAPRVRRPRPQACGP